MTTVGAGTAWAVGRLTGSRAKARTIGLAALVGTQLGQTMTSGEFSRPVILTTVASAGALSLLISTPGISHFFGCRPMGPIAWSTAIGASVAATLLGNALTRRVETLDARALRVPSAFRAATEAMALLRPPRPLREVVR